MNRARTSVLGLLLVVGLAGCQTYGGYYALSNSRKMHESDIPLVAKIAATPIVMIVESVIAPVPVYIDAMSYAPENADGSTYWSFLGWRTLINEDIPIVYMVFGGIPTLIVDLVWFPVAGIADIARGLMGDED